jgi:hypothetical protein
MALDGPINGLSFQAYVDQVPAPELRFGVIAITDSFGGHKDLGVRGAI